VIPDRIYGYDVARQGSLQLKEILTSCQCCDVMKTLLKPASKERNRLAEEQDESRDCTSAARGPWKGIS